MIAQRVAPAAPRKDGKQTPYRGHPVFVAQHATATCCRTVLDTVLEGNVAIGAGDDGIDVDSASTTLTRNVALHNGDLGSKLSRACSTATGTAPRPMEIQPNARTWLVDGQEAGIRAEICPHHIQLPGRNDARAQASDRPAESRGRGRHLGGRDRGRHGRRRRRGGAREV
ncbi:MAG: DUF4186 domain-containing protein [Gaiellaceae bacterium MAG52_C11]|nr:DUF4186 domain-containing protein [Candidatus Gaiellasilicea maunaloa]